MLFDNFTQTIIPLQSINYINEYFKISKPLSPELIKSIKQNGVLESVILVEGNGCFIPVCGHNRMLASIQTGLDHVPAKIINELSEDDFKAIITLKLYNNLTGTIGKLKSLYILKEYFKINKKQLIAIAHELSIPDALIETTSLKKIIGLPSSLSNYIDSKNIPYKFIMPVLRLSDESIQLVDAIANVCQLRVNYFRDIVVMIEDICRNQQNESVLKKITVLVNKENITDDEIYRNIYMLRYPQYSEYVEKINYLKNKFLSYGLKIEVPEYLEGNVVNIIIQVKKNEVVHPLLQQDREILALVQSIVALL